MTMLYAYTPCVPRRAGLGRPRKRADGRGWEDRVQIDGKRYSVYGKTSAEAARKKAEILQLANQGVLVSGPTQTVEHFMDRWLTDVARHTVRPSTFDRYSGLVRNHVNPALGKLPLGKVTSQHLARLYASLLETQAPRSVRYLHAVLHRAFAQAVSWNLMLRNPADAADPPRAGRTEMKVLDPEQCRVFLDAVAGEPLEALYVLALTTGMRQGELLALRWTDIDLETRRLQVRRNLVRINGKWHLAEPKTARSRRAIQLSDRAIRALKAQRVRQVETRLLGGEAWSDHGLVFTDALGMPLERSHLSRSLGFLLKRLGLPKLRFHDLRHSAATLLMAQGINPKVVSEILGHSSVSLTLDVYSHSLPMMQRQAADAMDEALSERSGVRSGDIAR